MVHQLCGAVLSDRQQVVVRSPDAADVLQPHAVHAVELRRVGIHKQQALWTGEVFESVHDHVLWEVREAELERSPLRDAFVFDEKHEHCEAEWDDGLHEGDERTTVRLHEQLQEHGVEVTHHKNHLTEVPLRWLHGWKHQTLGWRM